MKHTEKVTIGLQSHEALVLFDWLASLDLKGHENEPDDATQQLLWVIEGSIEKQLASVVNPAYRSLLAEAKAQILSDTPSDSP
jgi:hypothetical protein